ncbi:MAG: hypothetical protein F6K30_11505 [Cyanothece sp. SIO2G6]|nr:hypothetical protein [Cyanothece sp. SIO2G6]
MAKIVLFLDIDGVIHTRGNSGVELLGSHQGKPLHGCPSVFVKPLLQAIDRTTTIKPFWLSSGWRQAANVWNQWARISPWSIGYPLSFRQTQFVLGQYRKKLTLDEVEDAKTIATLYHSPQWADQIVWIEDGFSESAINWSRFDSRVILIDTTHLSDPDLTGIQAWNIELILQTLAISLAEFY